MTRSRGSLGHVVAIAVAAAGTGWVSLYAWGSFSERPGGFLNPLFLLAVVVAGVGVGSRWLRWPAPLVLLAQVVVSGLLACLLIIGAPLPVGDGWTELQHALGTAVDVSQRYSAPVPATAPPIDPLLIPCGLACLLLVDLFACTLRRVSLAGLPLLLVYSIPVSLVGQPIGWWVFVATAAGFLAMLFLQEGDQLTRWGRPIGLDPETGDPISWGAGTRAVRRTAGTVGGLATGLALVLPAVIPTGGLHVFDFGPGSGGGDDIRIDNPTTDLVRDLKRGADVPLIRVTTTDPDPSYLRIVALTRFSNVEWSPGDRDVPTDQRATGPLPPPVGVGAEIGRREVPYQVQVLPAFDSSWLPTQMPAGRVQAPGDWRYDKSTMDFLAVPDDLTTAGMSYSMTGLDLDITAEDLEAAGSSSDEVKKIFTDLPPDLPPIVRELTAEVTEDQPTRFDKAVALQSWFRSDGGFTYTLATAPGSGYDALVDFLSDRPGGRRGYCEQFASAMAVMARVLGIPARVAVGFLRPTPAGPNTWVYGSRDLHAWPELFFDGVGWVRFEPTPAARAAEVPSYTIRGPDPTTFPTESAAAQPSQSVVEPSRRPSQSQDEAAAVGKDAGRGSGSSWTPVVALVVTLAVVAIALLLPRLVRRRRRERRLSAGGPEEVWAELRDTARDLGVPWPAGRSPRETRDALVDHLGRPVSSTTADRPAHGRGVAPEGAAALDRIVADLEVRRYARQDRTGDRSRLRADARTVLACLAGGAPRSTRRRADWWPRSVLSQARRTTSSSAPGPVEARYGGVVDHVN